VSKHGPTPFDRAAAALYRSASGREAFGVEEYTPLAQGLGRYLRAGFPTLKRDEIVDLVSLALERFLVAAGQSNFEPERPAGAYLTTIARNAAIDALRRERAAEQIGLGDVDELPEQGAAGDAFERRLEILSGRQQTDELRRLAAAAGRGELVELVETYLRLAESGRSVSLRELGKELGLSHTEVRLRLDELAALSGRSSLP